MGTKKKITKLLQKYGVFDYLRLENFEESANKNCVNNLIENVNKEIEDNYNKHSAITHYMDTYNFVPPFVLTILADWNKIKKITKKRKTVAFFLYM